MQALLKRAGSSILRPASPYAFRIQTTHSLWPEPKLVVEGLASTVDDRVLRDAFSPYGHVTEARVVVDIATGSPIGKVAYGDHDSCNLAVVSMDQWELHGQTVHVNWAPPPGGYSIDPDEIEVPFSLLNRTSPTSLVDRWTSLYYEYLPLAPGTVLLKNFLSLLGQADIVNICQKRALGPGGFYTPTSPSGHKLALRMMCYGRQWDPVARYGKQYRSDDGSYPPPIPDEFMSLAELAIDAAQKPHAFRIPTMRPDICVANYYTVHGRLAPHQDCHESFDSLEKKSPVVSVSIGDSAEFWFGPRDEINKVRLDSGDVLIFGGTSRLSFHGVRKIFPWSAPRHLSIATGLRPGRLNLTLKKY